MGAWGIGVFANDWACDYFGGFISEIIKLVENDMNDEFRSDPEECKELLVNIEILSTLLNELKADIRIPKSQNVISWKSAFLKKWDDFYSESEDKDDEGRKVAVNTFDKLIKAVETY